MASDLDRGSKTKGHGSVSKDIYKLIIPATFQNILEIGIGLITTVIVGRLLADDISAKGICDRLLQFDWALFRGIGIGAMLMIARSFGAGEAKRCKHIAQQAYMICLPCSILLIAVVYAFPRQLLGLMASDEAILQKAVEYLKILILSSPFTAISSMNTAAFNGRGDTKTPMIIAIIMNCIGIASCYILVFGIGGFAGFGLIGSAISTVIAKAVSATLGLWLLYMPSGIYKDTEREAGPLRLDKQALKGILSGGLPVSGEAIAWQLSTMVLSRAILSYGSGYYAAYLLGLQAETLCEAPAFGFSVATMSLCAIAIGKKNEPLLRSYFKKLMQMTLVVAAITTAVLFFGSSGLMKLLNDDPILQSIGAAYIAIMALGQPAQATYPVFSGALRAAGYKKLPMIFTTIGIWAVRVPIALIAAFVLKTNITVIWFAIVADQIVRLVLGIIYFIKKKTLDISTRAEAY